MQKSKVLGIVVLEFIKKLIRQIVVMLKSFASAIHSKMLYLR